MNKTEQNATPRYFTDRASASPAATGSPLGATLSGNEVHVWIATRDLPLPHLEDYRRLLSAEEQNRAARFLRECDRQRYIAGRGGLRRLLGRYTGQPPEGHVLISGPDGKPELAPESNPDGLQFNLSHSEAIVLYAFARQRRVGVDVEQIRPDVDTLALAERFFTATEAQRIEALPAEQRLVMFFALWTQKEAYLKARGDGIAYGLDRCEISFTPDPHLATPYYPSEAHRWTLHRLDIAPGYAAALAVEASPVPDPHQPTIIRLLSLTD